MASTKFEVSMEIFKFQGEPDVSVTLTGKSPTELDTALKTLETILARTANDQRVPEVRRENPAGRAGTVRVHLPGLQEGELRPDERRGRRNRKREVLLRLRPERPEAHMEPGQALLYDVRRAG